MPAGAESTPPSAPPAPPSHPSPSIPDSTRGGPSFPGSFDQPTAPRADSSVQNATGPGETPPLPLPDPPRLTGKAPEPAPSAVFEDDAAGPPSDDLCVYWVDREGGRVGGFLRILNRGPATPSSVILRSGTKVQDGSALSKPGGILDWGADLTAGLQISFQEGAARRVLSWPRLPASASAVNIVVENAGGIGHMVFEGAHVPCIQVRHAADIQSLRIVQTETGRPPRAYRIPPSESAFCRAPEWALQRPWRRIIVCAGAELNIGRESDCTWPVYCRTPDGYVWMRRPDGRILSESENRAGWPEGAVLNVSRVHITLRRDAECIWGMDGTPSRASVRGVFQGGMRLDKGWNPLRSDPLTLHLGNPADPLSPELCVERIRPSNAQCLLALTQRRTTADEILLWTLPGEFVGFANGPFGGWCPAWFAHEAGLGVAFHRDAWHVVAVSEDTRSSRMLMARDVLRIGGCAYAVERVEGPRLSLVRHTVVPGLSQ